MWPGGGVGGCASGQEKAYVKALRSEYAWHVL